MRILTFTRGSDHIHRVGILTAEQRIIDLWEWNRTAKDPLPFSLSDMLSLIMAGPTAQRRLAQVANDTVSSLSLDDVHPLAPIPRPHKNVVCVGWNYRAHFAEAQGLHNRGQDFPSHPTFFTKAPTSVIGPYDPIPIDSKVSTQID